MRAKNESQNEKADVKSFPKLVIKAPKLTIRKYLKITRFKTLEFLSPRCEATASLSTDFCGLKMSVLMPRRHVGRPGNKRDIDLP